MWSVSIDICEVGFRDRLVPLAPLISCPLISRPVTTGFIKPEFSILACLYLIFKRENEHTSVIYAYYPFLFPLTMNSKCFMYFNLDCCFKSFEHEAGRIHFFIMAGWLLHKFLTVFCYLAFLQLCTNCFNFELRGEGQRRKPESILHRTRQYGLLESLKSIVPSGSDFQPRSVNVHWMGEKGGGGFFIFLGRDL